MQSDHPHAQVLRDQFEAMKVFEDDTLAEEARSYLVQRSGRANRANARA